MSRSQAARKQWSLAATWMARFVRIDSQMSPNRLICANHCWAPRTKPLPFANRVSGHLQKIANRRSADRLFCESILANRPNSSCESLCHLSAAAEQDNLPVRIPVRPPTSADFHLFLSGRSESLLEKMFSFTKKRSWKLQWEQLFLRPGLNLGNSGVKIVLST